MDAQAEELIRKTADAIADQIEHRMNVHFERMSDLVKRSADGYGATLESIDRRLDRLEKKVDNGFADQARVLRQHTSEINTVKYQLAPRRSPRK